MKRIISLYFFILLFTASKAVAQDTLPNFTVVERGDKVTISWVNPFSNIIQLNVQRSFDSIRNFTTVYSATSPQLPQNGFTELKMPTNRIFYRIFYVMEGGNYFFTQPKRVGAPSTFSTTSRDVSNPSLTNVNPFDKRIVTVKLKDTIYRQVPVILFKNFRDSILRQTKDTLISINDSLVLLKPFITKENWRPSLFVFANREGYINLSLPLYKERKYRIRFLEDDGRLLFEINHVKESPVILDKANFIHAGWFYFELYENDRLKEKNKFYLPKDF